jgi:undecaprenyl diphosphate synthase
MNDSFTTQEISQGVGVPRHVAIIMDGNGRWARSKGLPRIEGHRQGVKAVRTIVEESAKLGIKYLTLYCFSTENWRRPELEVSALMRLLAHYLEKETELLDRNGVALRAIGDLSRLPQNVQEILKAAEWRTAHHTGLQLILAISYGGREEILNVVRRSVEDALNGRVAGDLKTVIDEQFVQQRLYAADVPDPELLIRTSNEFRISNFLLWQLAYAEIVVSKVFWPDFGVAEFRRCLNEFNSRERRFGLTGEQLVGEKVVKPVQAAR